MDRVTIDKIRREISLAATPQRLQQWLIEYYTSHGESANLYTISTVPTKLVIPFLTRTEWVLSDRAPSTLLVFPEEPRISRVEHDTNFIDRRRQLFGQNIELNRIYCATRIISPGAGIQVEIGEGDYFQFISACGPLADEARFAVTYNTTTPYRDQMAPTLEIIETFPCQAHAIGIHSIVVGKRKDGQLSLVLHQRSGKVAINPGAFTGVPTGTFQPHSQSKEFDRSILNSFLYEFLEELYAKEKFDDIATIRARPGWWYELPEIKPVLELIQRGEAKFQLLGIGFDPSHCDLVICVCLTIYDPEYWETILRAMKMNWEANDMAKRWEYLLHSSEIDELLGQRLLQPGTAYCIDRARLLLTP